MEERLFRFVIRFDDSQENQTFIVMAEDIIQAENRLLNELYGFSFIILQSYDEDRKVFIIS